MTVQVGIVENPFDPSTWIEYEGDDARALIKAAFPTWPETARIFDLAGLGDWKRAAGVIDPAMLQRRDVTPQDQAGVDRLGELPGPLLVTLAPGDPVTAIIAVVAVVIGFAAAFLLRPHVDTTGGRVGSANNQLAGRGNKPRPGERIPDIYGTVRSIPDLIAQPYKLFVNNLEQEIAYLLVGRGTYQFDDVRDGDTPFQDIVGSGAQFYGPNTSPNYGAPQETIGTPIPDPVLSASKIEAVNGQILRPPNANFVRGNGNIRFIAPDTIETSGSIDFTDSFASDDQLTIGNANFGGQSEFVTITESMRFYPDMRIEFNAFDPSTEFHPGMSITLTNAVFTGVDSGGAPVTVDLSGVYVIATVNSTQIQLVV